ncbi:MAG: organomercurial lyase [Betaproteobacteria bacterium]
MELDDAARRVVESWPGVYYDAERRIIGFWGLTLHSMRHRLRMNGRELFAWCAWDTLFIPELLGASAEVASTCQGSGMPVRLRVGPHGIEAAEPEELHVSFVVPGEKAVRADVITAFCDYVHFFASERGAGSWLAEHPDAFLLPLSEAFEVGRLLNRRRYRA